MKITDIKVRKLYEHDKLKAIVSVTFDDELAVHDIKVIQGKEKLFVAMPSRKISEDRFTDIAHPIHSDFRIMLEESILNAYEEERSREHETETDLVMV